MTYIGHINISQQGQGLPELMATFQEHLELIYHKLSRITVKYKIYGSEGIKIT